MMAGSEYSSNQVANHISHEPADGGGMGYLWNGHRLGAEEFLAESRRSHGSCGRDKHARRGRRREC